MNEEALCCWKMLFVVLCVLLWNVECTVCVMSMDFRLKMSTIIWFPLPWNKSKTNDVRQKQCIRIINDTPGTIENHFMDRSLSSGAI